MRRHLARVAVGFLIGAIGYRIAGVTGVLYGTGAAVAALLIEWPTEPDDHEYDLPWEPR